MTVSWQEESQAVVTLQGKEQRDEIITIIFDDTGVQLAAVREEPT